MFPDSAPSHLFSPAFPSIHLFPSLLGGEYAYVRETFGPLPAFLILWMNLVLLTPATVAASACIFATYVLKPVFPTCEFIEIQMKLMEGDQK